MTRVDEEVEEGVVAETSEEGLDCFGEEDIGSRNRPMIGVRISLDTLDPDLYG